MKYIKSASDIPDSIKLNELASGISAVFDDILSRKVVDVDSLSKTLNISPSAISKIKNDWCQSDVKINGSNTAISRVVCYFLDNRDDVENPIVSALGSINLMRELEAYVHHQGKEEQNKKMVSYGYATAYAMLNVRSDLYSEESAIYCGKHLLFRNSSIGSSYVVSAVEIKLRDNTSHIWEYYHTRIDGVGRVIRSDGLLIPIRNNIYLISDIESGRGIENLTLNIPVSLGSGIMDGFISTLDGYGLPFVSKCALVNLDVIKESVCEELSQQVSNFRDSGNYYRPSQELIGTWNKEDIESRFGSISTYINRICCGNGVIRSQMLGEVI